LGPLVLIGAGLLVWAWFTGRLKGFTYDDVTAGLVFLLGLELLFHGRLLPGAALMAAAMLWGAWRRQRRPRTPPVPVEEARRLLGVRQGATLAEIREAHRRLIARVHPDAGGSDELAHRVNAARDALVAEMNRQTPRAS
jgi:hypothetical protein